MTDDARAQRVLQALITEVNRTQATGTDRPAARRLHQLVAPVVLQVLADLPEDATRGDALTAYDAAWTSSVVNAQPSPDAAGVTPAALARWADQVAVVAEGLAGDDLEAVQRVGAEVDRLLHVVWATGGYLGRRALRDGWTEGVAP